MADRVKFHYLKSSAFRTVHADGIVGGIAPTGFLNATFFSERFAIPTSSTHLVNPNGTLGEEVNEERTSREGVTRELEVNLVMSPQVVSKLHQWLGERLAEFKTMSDAAAGKKAGNP